MTKYFLRIDTHENNFGSLNQLFDYTKPQNLKFFWEYTISENDSDFVGGIEKILAKLEQNLDKIKHFNISVEDISFWYFYEYSNQCNMEFSPIQLKLIGNLGITFCISCWEK